MVLDDAKPSIEAIIDKSAYHIEEIVTGKKSRNNDSVNVFTIKPSTILKSNLPKYTANDCELIISNNRVPLSSSVTKQRDNPVMLPNISNTHKRPAESSGVNVSSPILKTTVVTEVITNKSIAIIL